MATSGAGSVALGLTLIAFGCGALYYAVEGERAQGLLEGRRGDAPVASAPCPSVVTTVAATNAVTAPTATTAAPAGTVSAAPSASAAAASTDGHLFPFAAGSVALAKTDLQRLVAFGAKLARFDNARITVEGYADAPGADDKTKLLARRRGLIVRQALVEAGVAGDHISVAPIDVANDASLAGRVRVKTTPPIVLEGETQ